MVKITLRGGKELIDTFMQLAGPKMGKGKRRAVQKGLDIVEKRAKQNFGKLSRTIPRAISTVIRVYQDENLTLGITGIKEIGAPPEDRLKRRLIARGKVRVTDLSPLAQKALIFEFGADPHIIEPVDPIIDDPRNALMDWSSGVAKVFGFKVKHPGTRPKAPMRRAFNSTVSAAREAEIRQLSLEIDKIATERQEVAFGLAEKTIIL